MKLTFGKFRGWDTEDLAKAGETGRNYLYWGSSNLRSPKWAREFERVLGLPVEYDETLMVKALIDSESDIDYDDAQTYVRGQLISIAEDDAYEKQLTDSGETLISEYAPKLNSTANKLRRLAHEWQWNWEGAFSPKQFSSRRNFDLFVEFMTKWDNR